MDQSKQKLTIQYSMPLGVLAVVLVLAYVFAEVQLSKPDVDIEALKWLHRAVLVLGLLGVAFAGLFIFRPMISRMVADREKLLATNAELKSNEEETRLNMEELEAAQEQLQAQQRELVNNENLLKKFVEKLKSREVELKEKNEALLTSEEELRQQQEEIIAQREVVERSNIRLQENEQLLKKFIDRLKKREVELKEKNEELSDKNNFIELSIRSAEQIQASILPSKELRRSILPEHSLFYRPKDVVSGDFFWMSLHGDKKLLGVIDCTGHGISGAFISLLGYSILRQVVYQQEIIQPDQVLVYLNKGISEYLRDEEHRNNYGMDASFCLIEPSSDISLGSDLIFSGAKQQLFYVKQGQFGILKGDRFSLGGHYAKKATSFTPQHLQLHSGDMAYLATDGFIDQADENRKKYSKKGFGELIDSLQRKPMYAQSQKLVQAFEKHRGNFPQRDDITVLGFRV